MTESLAEQIFHRASEAIDVLPAPVDGVLAEARELRRHRIRVAAASATAVVVVLAGLTWATTRPAAEEADPGQPPVRRSPNPVDVAWYGNGELHLEDVAVELPGLTDIAEVEDGAVYGDDSGSIGFVAGDGTRTLLGAKDEGAPVAVSGEHGWAAWVDPPGDGTELVLYDISAAEDVGRLAVPRGSRPVAIDQDRVFYTTPDGDFSWTPGGRPQPLERDGLLDVNSATRVYGDVKRIEMVQSFFSVSFVRPGQGAQLSPGGLFALTRPSRSLSVGPFRPLLYDTRTGDRVPIGLARDELAVDATFGPNLTVSYLVVHAADLGGTPDLAGEDRPLVSLRTCDLASYERTDGAVITMCHDIVPIAPRGEKPLLAH